MKTLKLRSPGKLNLRLDVCGKRHDGYHELRMINSAVSIFDDIEMQVIDKGIEIECENDPEVPSGRENIVYKACKEIMAYSNKNVGIRIKIKKAIPSAAGMGGGSSNAATVLVGLNQLLKINLQKDKLIKIGLRFGADIPFFINGSPAIATGIGEHLTKIKKLPKIPFVVVSPNVSVATKTVYDKFSPENNNPTARIRPDQETPTDDLPREFSTKKSVLKYMNNDLEKVTTKQYPVVNEIKDLLIKYGALGAQMTGSGPSVFGIFPNKLAAEKASKKLTKKGDGNWRVFYAENL